MIAGIPGINTEGDITWEAEFCDKHDGRQSSVAMNDNGDIIEVHRSENTDYLYYRLGTLTEDQKVRWGSSSSLNVKVKADNRDGGYPTIKINN